MPVIRGTWFFQQNGYGWTENMWLNGTDTDLNTYIPKALSYAQKRIACSGNETFIIAARVSQENVFRDALFASLGGSGLQGNTTKASDAPDTAILLNWRSNTGGKRRAHFMRGVWDAVIDEGGKYKPTAPFTAALNAYITEVTQAGWGWLTRGNRISGNVLGAIPTPAVVPPDPGTVTVTLQTDVFTGPFPLNTRVNISGVKGAYQINGSQLVIAADARHFTTKNRIAIFPYTAGGKVTWFTLQFQPAEQGAPDRVVERKVGRPSYKSRGRRPATVRS